MRVRSVERLATGSLRPGEKAELAHEPLDEGAQCDSIRCLSATHDERMSQDRCVRNPIVAIATVQGDAAEKSTPETLTTACHAASWLARS